MSKQFKILVPQLAFENAVLCEDTDPEILAQVLKDHKNFQSDDYPNPYFYWNDYFAPSHMTACPDAFKGNLYGIGHGAFKPELPALFPIGIEALQICLRELGVMRAQISGRRKFDKKDNMIGCRVRFTRATDAKYGLFEPKMDTIFDMDMTPRGTNTDVRVNHMGRDYVLSDEGLDRCDSPTLAHNFLNQLISDPAATINRQYWQPLKPN